MRPQPVLSIAIFLGTLLLVGCDGRKQAVVATSTAPVMETPIVTQLPSLNTERPPESTAEGPDRSSAELALGKYLFFDRALSGDQKLNCATCHLPEQAWTDGLSLSVGYPGSQYFRNTPSLLNSGAKEAFYWDGRIADLPTVVRDHLAEAHFMHADGRLVVERLRQKPQYVELFNRVYSGEPTYGRVLTSVAAYTGSLQSPDGPYDRFLANDGAALSAQAQEGLAIFEAHCTGCHSGPLLSDGQYHRLGVAENPDIFADPLRHITFRRFFRTLGISEYATLSVDLGRFALTRRESDMGQFLTPSLLEVGLTAPYMHNGIFESLEEVVAFYSDGGGSGSELVPLNFSASEQEALVAFLESLSGESAVIEVPDVPAYQLTVFGAAR